MARNVGTVLSNNLMKGLVTEATGLNFPDSAVTESNNTLFDKVGYAQRRRGIDLESDANAITYSDEDGVLREFVWQTVALTGGYTFLVLQVGHQVTFYELSVNESLSHGVQPGTINLNHYKIGGSPNLKNVPASFAAGAGYLFITHPYCDPIAVRFVKEDNIFEAARVTILIRDFEGREDDLAFDENPATLTPEHHYNLKNQGWFKKVRVGTVNNEAGGGGPLGPGFPLDRPPFLVFNAVDSEA